jgi:hypothetical protein
MLDSGLSVHRRSAVTTSQETVVEPVLRGVRTLSSEGGQVALDPTAGQVPVIRDSVGAVVGLEERIGAGLVVVLTNPLPLCNGYIDRADNGRLASDLISLAPPGTTVAFDEAHHQPPDQGSQSPLTAPLSTPWGIGVALATLVGFVGLLIRGRRFGPRLAPPGAGQRSTVEHVTAVGRLLRRARARDRTLQRLRDATRHALALRHGIAVGRDFDAALAARAPEEAARLAEADRLAARPAGGQPTEQELLEAARRLHRLAHPSTAHREEET